MKSNVLALRMTSMRTWLLRGLALLWLTTFVLSYWGPQMH